MGTCNIRNVFIRDIFVRNSHEKYWNIQFFKKALTILKKTTEHA